MAFGKSLILRQITGPRYYNYQRPGHLVPSREQIEQRQKKLDRLRLREARAAQGEMPFRKRDARRLARLARKVEGGAH